MSRPRRMLAALAAGATLALGVAACGDESDETSAPAQTTTVTEAQNRAQGVLTQSGGDADFDAQALYANASPGVVTVISVLDGSSQAVFGGGGGAAGQGSGFVISEDGEVLTNAHVVTDAATTGTQTGPLRQAEEVYVQFADQNQVEAEIVGIDPFADVALLRIDPADLDLTPLPLGSENDVDVGEGVAAIGSPFAQQQSLSVGIVSASDRSIESLTQFRIEGAIQTDASINPGNSGGPLIDSAGDVVGINQQIRTASGGNEGVGFAVPIDLAQRSIDQLRDDGEVAYAFAGVTTTALYPQLAEELDLDVDTGAVVTEVVPDSPADDAGLEPADGTTTFQGNPQTPTGGGDVITAVNGDQIVAQGDLPRLISLLDPRDVITLDIVRDGEEQQLELTLGERPEEVATGGG